MKIVTYCLVVTFLAITPLMFVISRMLDYFEDNCFLSGHAWWTGDEIHMLPTRRCRKCGQVQVKLPRLDKIIKGGWVSHTSPLNTDEKN